MIFTLRKTKEKDTSEVWQPRAGGCEQMGSKAVIRNYLTYLKEEKIILSLAHGKHSLGQTILEQCSDRRLQFASPCPLPAKPLEIRIRFRYLDKLLHFFDTRIVSTTGFRLKTTPPTEIFRLQHRNHARVEVPAGSSASFSKAGGIFANIAVRDVSAGGMLLCTDHLNCLRVGDLLTDVSLDLLLLDCNNPFRLTLREARIVRSVPEDRHQCYGASLSLSPRQEDALRTYVRLREGELFSKEVKSE